MFRLANVIFALASSLAVATQAGSTVEVEIMGLPVVFGQKLIGVTNCSRFLSKCHSTL